MLLTEAVEALCVASRADGRAPRTVEAYRQKLAPLLAFLGDMPVNEITITDARRYVASLRDRQTLYVDHPVTPEREGPLAPATITGHITAAKRLFNWLIEEGVIDESPMARIKKPRAKRREPKGVDYGDFFKLLAATKGDEPINLRDRAVLMFLFDTGCRAGGLCGLKVGDVDFERGLAVVTEKRDKARIVPFTEATAKALRDWLAVRPEGKSPWMFVGLTPHSKGPLNAHSLNRLLKRRAEAVGVTGRVNPHAFRHGFARYFLTRGGDLASLSQLMGHETLDVTRDYYAIFTVAELKEKHRKHGPLAGLEEE